MTNKENNLHILSRIDTKISLLEEYLGESNDHTKLRMEKLLEDIESLIPMLKLAE